MKNDPNSILTSTVITIMKIQDYINKGELIISDKILEQRYEYDVDKTAAEVKEILNGDDSDQSYELIEIVGKRVSRDLVKKYSFELFEYMYVQEEN
ncbi:hypothetical protein [Aerococcus viridans]